GERGAPVRAALADEPVAALGVAVDDELLAQKLDGLDRLLRRQFPRGGDRVPVAAQQLARRRAAPDPRQIVLFFARQHGSYPRLLFFRLAVLIAVRRFAAVPLADIERNIEDRAIVVRAINFDHQKITGFLTAKRAR